MNKLVNQRNELDEGKSQTPSHFQLIIYYNIHMLVDLLFLVAIIGLAIAIFKIKFSKESVEREIEEAAEKHKKEEKHQDQLEKQTDVVDRQTRTNSVEGWQGESDESDEQQSGEMNKKKQLRKEMKHKEKQQKKQAQQQFLQQQKEKREKYEKEAEEREKLEEERRKKQEEIIDQLREDERKRKEEEFNKWKDLFSVEAEGKEKLSQEEETRRKQAFNSQLTAALRKNKLSLLQDLSHKFKLSTKELVDKIRQFEQEKAISGIFDERGKYLVIQQDEWSAIKNYISARGRVKKTDIMTECARLIKIPDNVEEDLLQLISEGAEKE